MKKLKKSLLAAVSASAVMFSLAMPAMADWNQPDYNDVDWSVNNMQAAMLSLIGVMVPINVNQIKVLYIEDLLDLQHVNIIKKSLNQLSVNVLSIQNVLRTVKVANGSSILTFSDVLSHNNIPISDIISARQFNDGGLLVFASRGWCNTCTH